MYKEAKRMIENITFYGNLTDTISMSSVSIRDLTIYRLKEDFNVNLSLGDSNFLSKKLTMLSYSKLTEMLISAAEENKNCYNLISSMIILDNIMEEIMKEDPSGSKINSLESEFLDLIK